MDFRSIEGIMKLDERSRAILGMIGVAQPGVVRLFMVALSMGDALVRMESVHHTHKDGTAEHATRVWHTHGWVIVPVDEDGMVEIAIVGGEPLQTFMEVFDREMGKLGVTHKKVFMQSGNGDVN